MFKIAIGWNSSSFCYIYIMFRIQNQLHARIFYSFFFSVRCRFWIRFFVVHSCIHSNVLVKLKSFSSNHLKSITVNHCLFYTRDNVLLISMSMLEFLSFVRSFFLSPLPFLWSLVLSCHCVLDAYLIISQAPYMWVCNETILIEITR